MKSHFTGIPSTEHGLSPYIAQVRQRIGAPHAFVVRGTHKGAAFDQVYGETLCVHPLTQEFAYVAQQGPYQVVVQNQSTSLPYEAVWLNSLHYTPNGAALFFIAEKAGETFFVVNGVAERVFDSVLEIQPFRYERAHIAAGLILAVVSDGAVNWQTVQPKIELWQESKWKLT